MDAALPLKLDGLGAPSAVAIRREMVLTRTLSRLIRASLPGASTVQSAWLATLDGRAGLTHEPGTWLWDTADATKTHADHLDAVREVLKDCDLQDARPQRHPGQRRKWDVLIRTVLTSAPTQPGRIDAPAATRKRWLQV